MSVTLRDVAVGESGRVAGFTPGAKAYRKRLLSMGLTRGVSVEVTRCAPMGDPIEVRVRGYSLSLRKEEAASLIVEPGA
ncbi:MAG: FeoA family protein [Marivibrio sp.]|uniref:FeoA family protein n=1 Tax=Marivibrio sp. TaxID=2039719 RepID=UPI0032EDD815